MLPLEIKIWLNDNLGSVTSFSAASGGCINNGGTIEIEKKYFFIKWNNALKFPEMFSAESKGLKFLSQSSLKIPKVINLYQGTEYDALLLENISKGKPSKTFWEDFGRSLADMHRISNNHYGLDHTNYMGSLLQENEPLDNWVDFFVSRRLMPQVSLAKAKGYFNNTQLSNFENFYTRLPDLLSTDKPALVHGDLWNGNYLINQLGEPVLIDPAISFSHREVDLGMTRLFGGFEKGFYDSYDESHPTESGLEDRLDIYNLYPLLIHLNLFGSGYYSQVMNIVNRFI